MGVGTILSISHGFITEWIYHIYGLYLWYVKPGEKPAAVVKKGQFEAKTTFSSVVYIDIAGKGEKIKNQYYIENCLKPMVKALEIDRPKCGTRNLKILHDNARPNVLQNVNKFLKEHVISKI